VICDKPLTVNLKEALSLEKAVKQSGRIFALTHNYTGYPMVRHARAMVRAGDLGELRVVQAEYPQDWLTEKVEDTGQKQAVWRNDPKRAGAGGCLGDIGTHAYNLASFVTGLELDSLSADLTSFVKGRKLDDNVHIMLRFKGGAKGMLWASQVAPGNENNLKLRVYGTKGGLEWWQEHPNQLIWTPFNKAPQILSRGTPSANAAAARMTRVPPGHPEGYLEGFANIYTEVAAAIRAARSKKKPDAAVAFPTVEDGVKGIAFIEAAVKSSAKDAKWVKV
jgi:predicted dehydrogenase